MASTAAFMAPKRHQKHAPTKGQATRPTPAQPEPQQEAAYTVQDSDTIVLILGQTGAGKSTFINYALGAEIASVGHTLDSHTADIQPYPMDVEPGHRIVLIDTPGFNDTWLIDQDIMRRIVVWLQTSCKPSTKCAGIIYLYEITQARTTPKTSYMHPTKLEKPDAPKYVILATVKWNEVSEALGELREKQLNFFWQKMSKRGSLITRFGDSTESARAIIDMFQHPTTVEYILRELIRILGKLPSNTVDKKGTGGGFVSKLFGKLWGA